MDEVFAMIKANVARVRRLIIEAVEHDYEAMSAEP